MHDAVNPPNAPRNGGGQRRQSRKSTVGFTHSNRIGAMTADNRPQKPEDASLSLQKCAEASPFEAGDPASDARRFFDLSHEGIVAVESGIVIEANHRMETLCGYSLEELLGRPLCDLFRSFKIMDEISDGAEGAPLRPGPAIENRRTELLHRDGRLLPVRINAGLLEKAPVPTWLVVVHDLSSELKIKDELQKARQLESIAALSGGIAHDYNNLLTVIIGNISLVRSYIDTDEIALRMMDEAHEASMIAKSLTQKLITFSKGGAPLKEIADIAPLIRSATEFSLSGSNICCDFDFAADLHAVEIDRSQIGQAVHNIIMNARESMPEGGTIRVTARNAPPTQAAGPPCVEIRISDQGCGIARQHIEKIFDPYFSTKERGTEKGMGLGLSICHSIINQHNGQISVETTPGRGTTFSLQLPAAAAAKTVKPSLVSAEGQRDICGQGRILVMDDEEMIIRMVGLILTRLGYTAEFAGNGNEAVALYRNAWEKKAPFDAVILDLTVRGGMGGREAIGEIRRINPKVRAIVSSGYCDSPVMTEYEKYGFAAAVVKPFSLQELGESLQGVLSR
jgi:PAS domain S-box-containing protein